MTTAWFDRIIISFIPSFLSASSSPDLDHHDRHSFHSRPLNSILLLISFPSPNLSWQVKFFIHSWFPAVLSNYHTVSTSQWTRAADLIVPDFIAWNGIQWWHHFLLLIALLLLEHNNKNLSRAERKSRTWCIVHEEGEDPDETTSDSERGTHSSLGRDRCSRQDQMVAACPSSMKIDMRTRVAGQVWHEKRWAEEEDCLSGECVCVCLRRRYDSRSGLLRLRAEMMMQRVKGKTEQPNVAKVVPVFQEKEWSWKSE